MKKHTRRRRAGGSVIADTPLALWVLFVLFTIPFLDLASVCLRYTFFVTASRDAAHEAARAKSFFVDLSADQRSSVSMAQETAENVARSFSEINVTAVNTRLLITNIASGAVTIRTTPLPAPADTSSNLYEIETIVSGNINPLVTFNAGPMPGIPGLSAPVPVTVSSRELCENPQGLTQ